MDTDQPAPDQNPEKTSSDEQGTSPARSYDCTFCKRGFSNAQALGGHMNIHRRDKAKLIKQEASPTRENTQQQSLDISEIVPSYSPNHSKDKNIPRKWPWVLQDDDDDGRRDKTKARDIVGSEIFRQLPLFDEKPSITDQNPRNQVREGIEKGFPSSQGSELDLELRLGLEPAQDSTPSRITKKFF